MKSLTLSLSTVGGAGAQEENLFRRSTYCIAIEEDYNKDHKRKWQYVEALNCLSLSLLSLILEQLSHSRVWSDLLT